MSRWVKKKAFKRYPFICPFFLPCMYDNQYYISEHKIEANSGSRYPTSIFSGLKLRKTSEVHETPGRRPRFNLFTVS